MKIFALTIALACAGGLVATMIAPTNAAADCVFKPGKKKPKCK